MSMCMYIARGKEGELRKLAENPDALCGFAPGAGGAFAGSGLDISGKLARIDQLLGGRPDLRQAVGDILRRAGAPNLPAGAAPPGAAPDLASLMGALGTLAGRGGAGRSDAPEAAAGRPPVVDLHKSWHMFHFLFTGRAAGGMPPASLLLDGGEEVGEDLGYGPPRLLDPAATAALAGFVGTLTVEELKGRLDGPRMAALSIYPAFDAADAADEYADDIAHYFPQLRDHLAAAAAAGEAALLWLS
jgi:hypothetical protein